MPTSKRPNILIVDDRKENLFAMTDLLRDEKLTIFTAQSGNEALTLMLRHEFAVVLMDVMMPEMDGFETVDLMFTNEAIRDTPVIFLTAINKEDQHIYKGYEAGAVDYIFKPSNPEILKSKVWVFVKLYLAMEERSAAEVALRLERDLAQGYLDTVETMIVALDSDGRVQSINRKGCQLFGCGENELLGRQWFSTCLPQPEGMERVYPFFLQLMQGVREGAEYQENSILTQSGELRQIAWHNSLLHDAHGRIVGTLSSGEDITERKQTEMALKEITQRLTLATSSAELGVWDWDLASNKMTWDDRMLVLYGITKETFSGGIEAWQNGLHPEDRDKTIEECQAALRGEKEWDTEFRVLQPDGTIKHIKANGVVIRDSAGSSVRMLGINFDITKAKQAEEALKSALAEKEVLLREVHHRVKNNMAAIIGLFDMQEQDIENQQAKTALKELSTRVRAMSLVHEKLYRTESLARIAFQDYIESLVSYLSSSFYSEGVSYEIAAQGVEVPLDLAVPCGMIINELVINAFKYAFPKERSKPKQEVDRIQVTMSHDNGNFSLSVADNGVGLPSGFDLQKVETLGLTLVRMLGQHQLGGRYEIDHTCGTRFNLVFSLRKGR